jgi:hypothetical protein
MKNQILFITLLCVCIGVNAQTPSNSKNENEGLQNAVLLPEVVITDELGLNSLADDDNAERAEGFQSADFQKYVSKIERAIIRNDNNISSIKMKLLNERGEEAVKGWRKITSLEIENYELKRELLDYLHYGKGNWNLFKKEMNEDLRPLAEELEVLNNELP